VLSQEYTEQTTIYGILEKIGGQKKCKVSIKPLIYNAEFETIEELINYYENLT
jgi:hypothetical protein